MDKSSVKVEDVLLRSKQQQGHDHGEGSEWYNELGSMMKFLKVENGQCSGLYCSAVGEAKKEYPFVGRYDQTRMGVIGWTVSWENQYMNAHSVTTWSGQFQYDESIKDWVILTTWLLTHQTEPNDDWDSTNVGMDTFRYVPQPIPEKIQQRKLRCQRSHPTSA